MFSRKPTSHFRAQTGLSEHDKRSFLLERVGGIEPPTKPWEGLVLPLNHTRRRFGVYALLAVMASVFFTLHQVRAQEVPVVAPYHFDESLIATGWTLRLADGGNLTVFPGVLTATSDVLWSPTTDTLPNLPKDSTKLGSAYRLTVTGVTALNTTQWKLAAALPDAPSTWRKNIWIYDLASKTWSKATTKLNPTTGKLQAGFASLDAYVVVVEDPKAQEGVASYYGTYTRTTKLKYVAASNSFSKGTKLRVTNLETKKSVDVQVVDTGAFTYPRVIDLSTPAFEKIQPRWKGLAKVRVEVIDGLTSTAPAVVTAAPISESIPQLTVTSLNTSATPKVTASAYRVLDAGSGKILAEKSSDTVLPIASIVKLMTTIVFLDTKPNLRATFVYSKSDGTGSDANGVAYGYNNLKVRAGDVMQVRDLFYATLVGSANNGATALVRASGLSRPEFVARMNAKAKQWGMTDTHFVEASGLDPANTSTAQDVAIMAAKAFNSYEPIRYATTKSSYAFTASLSGGHTVKTTDVLLQKNNGLTVTGGKTGFINESKYTYVVRVKNEKGAQVVVAVLGASSSATRFNEAASLASWAWKNFTWS